jgi:hypothetical protein
MITNVRRSVATMIALVVGLAALASYIWPSAGLAVCRDAIGPDGTHAIVSLCGPISIADLVGPAILVLVLVAPDLTKITIPGLVEIERKLERTVVETTAVARVANEIQQQVTNLSQQMTLSANLRQSQRVEFNQTLHMVPDSTQTITDANEKAAARGIPPQPPPAPDARSADRLLTETQLKDSYNQLKYELMTATMNKPGTAQVFRILYQTELEALDQAIQTIVEIPRAVSDAFVSDMLRVAEALRADLDAEVNDRDYQGGNADRPDTEADTDESVSPGGARSDRSPSLPA